MRSWRETIKLTEYGIIIIMMRSMRNFYHFRIREREKIFDYCKISIIYRCRLMFWLVDRKLARLRRVAFVNERNFSFNWDVSDGVWADRLWTNKKSTSVAIFELSTRLSNFSDKSRHSWKIKTFQKNQDISEKSWQLVWVKSRSKIIIELINSSSETHRTQNALTKNCAHIAEKCNAARFIPLNSIAVQASTSILCISYQSKLYAVDEIARCDGNQRVKIYWSGNLISFHVFGWRIFYIPFRSSH